METLQKYYSLSLEDAAKEMNIGVTALKKMSRNHGIKRWPHRKLNSITKLIEELKQLESSCGTINKPKNFALDIISLEEKKKQLIEDPNLKYRELVPKYISNYVKNNVKNINTPKPTKTIRKPQQKKLTKPHQNLNSHKDFKYSIPTDNDQQIPINFTSLRFEFPKIELPKYNLTSMPVI